MPHPLIVSQRFWRAAVAVATVGALWFILCRHLSTEWSTNEQYSYGWFVPFFAAFLFWLRWEDRPGAFKANVQRSTSNVQRSTEATPSGARIVAALIAITALALLFPIRLFEVGNPDWRPLGWLHAAVVVALTLFLIWRTGGGAWLRHFAFPVAFIFVAIPWVSPIETPIVQGLMHVVATIASEVANLCGIPAQLEGSVIRINSGVVGVNEACSGVRSLQTSLMIGLLFGELKRLNVSRRAFLVVAALGVAFLANCARAFFLVWIAATRNLAAVGEWHDLAGYAIVALVFIATIALASLLAQKEAKSQRTDVGNQPPTSDLPPPASSFRLSTSYFLLPLLWVLAVETAVELWYRSHEHNLIATSTWDVTWPESAAGFRDLKINEDVRATLHFDRGREATWRAPVEATHSPPQPLATFFMFFFRWEPGTTSILRARSHRPDICLPNTGWRVTGDHGVRLYPGQNGVSMPFRHFAFARPETEKREVSAHAFFCQREDRVARDELDRFNLTSGVTSDWMRSDRLRVVREGLRNQGQQILQLVIVTPQTFDASAAEAEFAKLVPAIVK